MFHVKVLEQIDKGKGYWDYQKVGVFRGDTQIGEFIRNYHSYGVETFSPFQKNGEWYAVCSPDYMGVSVMSLPDCKMISEPHYNGMYLEHFCPIECWVPKETDGKFGFVQGCTWGDDCGWKLKLIDLTDPQQVRLKSPFGYHQLPSGKLKDLIEVEVEGDEFYVEAETSGIKEFVLGQDLEKMNYE